MDKSRLALTILVFWTVFAITLMVMEYDTIKGLYNSDIFIDTSRIEKFNPDFSGVFFGDVLFATVMIGKTILIAIISIFNLILFLVQFLYIFIRTLTLTFSGINYFIGRFLNLIQILSIIFIGLFIRG